MAVLAPALASCSAHADPGVSRTGYVKLPDGVQVAYDLTMPAASGRFPVALEYNHYSAGVRKPGRQAVPPERDATRLPAGRLTLP